MRESAAQPLARFPSKAGAEEGARAWANRAVELWNEHAPPFACQVVKQENQVVCTKCGRKAASLGCVRTPCRASPEGADKRRIEAKATGSAPVKGGRLPSSATVEVYATTTKAIKDTKMLVDSIIGEEKASAQRRRILVRNAAEKATRG